MLKTKPISMSVIEKDDELGFSRLELNFKGEDINRISINSIKRIIQSEIPIFIFSDINITENTSIFNNNYVKNHIKNIPVWGIENNIDEFIKNVEEEEDLDETNYNINDDIDLTVTKPIDMSSLNKLNIYINYKNESKEIYTVTTNDAKFYYKEKLIDSPYKNPVQIVKLQPDQNIKLSTQTELGIEELSGIFAATSVCFFKKNSENDYNLILESRGQITEKRIIQLALSLLNKKLHKFTNNLAKNNGLEGKIIVIDEDHTLGNLISYGMQNHQAVEFFGYNTPHPLKKQILFHFKLKTGNLNNIIKDVVSYYENVFDNISKLVEKQI